MPDPTVVALRWVIEHKSCSGFAACWAAAPVTVRSTIEDAWGADPWPDQQNVLAVDCPTCRTPAGYPCRVWDGSPARAPHIARRRAVAAS